MINVILEVVVPLRIALTPMNQSKIITLEPTVEIHISEKKTRTELKELQRLVCGHIEAYPIRTENFVFLVDEEGL